MSHFYQPIHEARVKELVQRLAREIVAESRPLEAEVAVSAEPVPWADRTTLRYRPIKTGETWGRRFDCGWFHVTGTVPQSWKGAEVALHLDFGGELLLFDGAGVPLSGLTNGSVFDNLYNKDFFRWLPSANGDEIVDFWIDAGANGLFGLNRLADPVAEGACKEDLHGSFDAAISKLEVCRFDREKWLLKIDLEVILSLVKSLPEHSARRISVLRATSRALDLYPPERGGAPAVREALAKTVWGIGVDPASVRVTAIGHSHIDVEWLWPLRETVRKVGRTFSSQIFNLERYPNYRYGSSQAQLYALCKEHYPQLYAKVKKAVADGLWEVQGGMWVEADCNIPSGESLVRQCLYGQRFFKDEFGIVPRNLWLPDVFGYSGNLPQILRQCGIDFFLTQKLSWNRYNKFPHNSFVWEGIDGSRVVAHFPPEDTYNADLLPESLRKHENNNGEAGIVDVAISLFGVGDGGGGPQEEYIERGLRCAALNGCPPVSFGFAQSAMDEIAKSADELDTWRGELYFEMHRGTYTTQAAQKLANRRAEEALRAAEMLCAVALAFPRSDSQSGKRFDYPADEIGSLWKSVLLCQFHDIIPGSSIHRVYEESGALVRSVAAKARSLAACAAASILEKREGAMTLFNVSSTEFRGRAALPEGWSGVRTATGTVLAVQRDGTEASFAVTVPPRTFVSFFQCAENGEAPSDQAFASRDGSLVVLENGRVRYEIDTATLRVISAIDKECAREFILRDRPGNDITLFDDHPPQFDAWDFEEYVLDMPVSSASVVSCETFAGPVSAGIRAVFRIGQSLFSQTIRLESGSKRLDFETATDNWCESHKLLRAAFPLDVATHEARFEIQYGTVARPTDDNTKWQYAQFESCAHRYADVSEPDFGVALLNDSKYGYRAKGRELSLSLLRSPTEPDPVADRGAHRFVYSILPHALPLSCTQEVVSAAAVLNQGVERFEGFAVPAQACPEAESGAWSPMPVSLSGEGVELAVLKKSEDGDALIVRIVETRGRRASCRLDAAFAAVATPVLANELGDLGGNMAMPASLVLRPFEIKTLRVERQQDGCCS